MPNARILLAMQMTKTRMALMIAAMTIALGGLIGLQAYLLKFAYEQKEQTFRRNVLMALNATAQRLETGRAAMMAVGQRIDDSLPQVTMAFSADTNLNCDSVTVRAQMAALSNDFSTNTPLWVNADTLRYQVEQPQHVLIKIYDRGTGRQQIVVDTFRTPGVYIASLSGVVPKDNRFMYMFRTDSAANVFEVSHEFGTKPALPWISADRKTAYVRQIIDNLVIEEFSPVTERIDPNRLDSLLKVSLREAGIDIEPAVGVRGVVNDSLWLARPQQAAAELKASDLRASLFPHDMFAARSELVVHFPEGASFVWRQMATLLTSSLVFTVIIGTIFVYSLRVIVAQKRFAGRVVDFINNMTHEFKTPISTVSLAAEAIMRPDVIDQSEKVTRYGRMIMDENRRMRLQVEKILQMAMLEEGNYEFKSTPTAMNEIVRRAIDGIALQVENRQGRIDHALNAPADVVSGDALHLSNVINNLLDNAVKYSSATPMIAVETRTVDSELEIVVADQGIGMTEAEQKLVFDKYYRVPTGNIHNVKGFGLGLTYVKLVVEAHRGRIKIDSAPNKGTEVVIRLPLANPAENA